MLFDVKNILVVLLCVVGIKVLLVKIGDGFEGLFRYEESDVYGLGEWMFGCE